MMGQLLRDLARLHVRQDTVALGVLEVVLDPAAYPCKVFFKESRLFHNMRVGAVPVRSPPVQEQKIE